MENNEENGMTLIVKTITRIVLGFIMLFGWYIILYGHLTPGGGFAGGVILAAGFILLTLGFGKNFADSKMPELLASMLDNLGALLFWLMGMLGLVGGYFFLNVINHGKPFHLLSAGNIPISNIGIGIKVGFSLFLVFLALSAFERLQSKTFE